uniref:Uncharacterized protein n=1 Tax=Ovis aries TaxID=9940 RepID=A0AC11EG13_SHEEP
MSGPAATAFRWKKYRFDVPGHVARQSGKHLPDEHNDVQKKTFTKWINARFSKNVSQGVFLKMCCSVNK